MTQNHGQQALQSTFRFAGPGMDEIYGGNKPPAFGTPPGGQMSQTMPVGTESAWGGSQQPFEGFDFSRPQNIQKSAKDAYAHFASKAPPPPVDKRAAGDWFNQHIAPRMNELGHNIDWVDGDKFGFTNWQGSFDVDNIRGAGAPGWAHAWQADPRGGGGAVPSRGGQAPVMPGQQSDLMAMILESLQQGQLDPQMLLQQQLSR